MFTLENLKKALKDPIGAILYLLWIKRFFSQWWEDIILNWLLKDKENWLYIDVWANHPIHGNNTYWLYKRWWRGINIEPNKKMLQKFFSKRSKDNNLQIGVGKSNSDITFHVFDEHQMCTCDLETVERYKKVGNKVIDTYSVPVRTLEKLCDTYVKNKHIDILSVDVEWRDMDVLESNNRDKYKPTYIILETVEYGEHGANTWTKQNDVFDPYLKSKWYAVVAETGINTIYQLKQI